MTKDRHEAQMEARKKARELGHALGPFEDAGFIGRRFAHCRKSQTHFVALKPDPIWGWVASGTALLTPCSVGQRPT